MATVCWYQTNRRFNFANRLTLSIEENINIARTGSFQINVTKDLNSNRASEASMAVLKSI